MSQTFSPEGDRRRRPPPAALQYDPSGVTRSVTGGVTDRAEATALVATLLAAVLAVIVFFPVEGRLLTPLHGACDALLGQAAFVLPLGMALAAGIGFAHRSRPHLAFPRRRLAGLGLITIGLLPAERLLGQSTGLLGEWFTHFLIDLLGFPIAVATTVIVLGVGAVLTFDPKRLERLGRRSLSLAAR
jgi:hypothetical protein